MELVRVRVPESGAHVTVSAAWAESAGLEVLDEPALRAGLARPPTTEKGRRVKPRRSVKESAAVRSAGKGGEAASTPEEASE